MDKVVNNINYDVRSNTIKKSQSNNTVPAPIEDKLKSKAAKYAIGATCLAAIVIAGLATKGKLWGNTATKFKPSTISIEEALRTWNKKEDSIYDFLTKSRLQIPENLQDKLKGIKNIEKILVTTNKKNGNIVLKYKNSESNALELLSFDNQGQFLKRILANKDGYTVFNSKGEIIKTFEKSIVRKPKELFSKELVDVGTSSNKSIYKDGKLVKKEIHIRTSLKNDVQGSEKIYRVFGKDGIIKDVERTCMQDGDKSLIFEKDVLGNKRRIKIDNNDWIEIKDSQLADLIPKEHLELFKKGKGWR